MYKLDKSQEQSRHLGQGEKQFSESNRMNHNHNWPNIAFTRPLKDLLLVR